MSRSELRAKVFHRDGDACIWPQCHKPADELAHLHSVGMGGRPSADEMDNAAAMCEMHARFSDGELAGHGITAYQQAHFDLFGARFLEIPADRLAWERAETLKALIMERT